MNPDEANTMAAIIAGMIASQVALSKFLIAEGVISQDALVAYLEKTVATLTPGVLGDVLLLERTNGAGMTP